MRGEGGVCGYGGDKGASLGGEGVLFVGEVLLERVELCGEFAAALVGAVELGAQVSVYGSGLGVGAFEARMEAAFV